MVLFLGHGRMFTARALLMHRDAENYIDLHTSTQTSLTLECIIICNSLLKAAMLGLCIHWKYFPSVTLWSFHILILGIWYQTLRGTLPYWHSMRQNYQKGQQSVSHFHNSVFILLFIVLPLHDLLKHFTKPHERRSSGREQNKHIESESKGNNSK